MEQHLSKNFSRDMLFLTRIPEIVPDIERLELTYLCIADTLLLNKCLISPSPFSSCSPALALPSSSSSMEASTFLRSATNLRKTRLETLQSDVCRSPCQVVRRMNYDLDTELNDLLVESKYIATAFTVLKSPSAPHVPVQHGPVEGEISVEELKKALRGEPGMLDDMEACSLLLQMPT